MTADRAYIRADGPARTFVSADGDETPLPAPADLKAEALAWLSARARRGDDDAARAAGVLAGCELAYEVVGDGPGAVAVTDEDRAWLLSDDDDNLTWYVVAALREAYPDLRGFRALARS